MRKQRGKLELDKTCCSQQVSDTQDEDTKAYGYKIDKRTIYFIWIAYFVTFGLLKLVFYWFPRFDLWLTHKKCPLNRATKILLISVYKKEYTMYTIVQVKEISTNNVKVNEFFSVSTVAEQSILDNMKNSDLKVNLKNGTKSQASEYRVFWYRRECYVWDNKKSQFSLLATAADNVTCLELNPDEIEGLSHEEQVLRRIIYGDNKMHVPVQSVGELLIQETFDPFYVFQVTSLVLWIIDLYLSFSILIFILIMIGVASSIIQTRKNQMNLREKVESTAPVKVIRNNGEFECISSAELVPGDIIELPRRQGTIVCDAVLLTGTCVVNESVLTGESVPVFKTPLHPSMQLYDSNEHSNSTLFCGTTVIQANSHGNEPVLVKVIRTGLQTYEGSLVISILYLPVSGLKFEKDARKMYLILFITSVLACIYECTIRFTGHFKDDSVGMILDEAFTLYSTFISPTLPVVIMSGITFARIKLKKQKIYCTKPKAINMSGAINFICFDKTGTLTENDMTLIGVIPIQNGIFGNFINCSELLKTHRMFEGMLVCHSLTLFDNEIVGDSMELRMFQSTGWKMEEEEINKTNKKGVLTNTIIKPVEVFDDSSEFVILQRYKFSSTLQRMSVIALKKETNELWCYCKGSPEMILSLSQSETCPENFDIILQEYTKQGFRVIAFGCSRVPEENRDQIEDIPRDQVEKNLEFLGFIVYENKLKTATTGVITELRGANIRMSIVTGDNIETATSIAKECGILNCGETIINVKLTKEEKIHFEPQNSMKEMNSNESITSLESIEHGLQSCNYKFALTGKTWKFLRTHRTDLLQKICVRGAVFARMTSDQKKQLVTELAGLGFYVAMCGDGVNDCEALRAAHVGLSLSESTASVASPFTSLIPDISCMTILIKEGRAALATSLSGFKFTVAYGCLESISTLVLVYIGSAITNIQYIFLDFNIALIFNLLFGLTATYKGQLSEKRLNTSLVSLTPMLSLILNLITDAIFQMIAFYSVEYQSWFTPLEKKSRTDYACYENYSVVFLTFGQLIMFGFLYSIGRPHREPIYTNLPFTIYASIVVIFCLYMALYPATWLASLFQFHLPPMEWRGIVLGMIVLNLIACSFIEKLLIPWIGIIAYKYKQKNPKKLYSKIELELQKDYYWSSVNYDCKKVEDYPSSTSTLDVKAKKTHRRRSLHSFENPVFTQDVL